MGVLAAVLVTFSMGVYSLLGKSLRQRLDASLHSATKLRDWRSTTKLRNTTEKMRGKENVRLVLNTMHQTSFPRPDIAVWVATGLSLRRPALWVFPLGRSKWQAPAEEYGDRGSRLSKPKPGGYRVAVTDVMCHLSAPVTALLRMNPCSRLRQS